MRNTVIVFAVILFTSCSGKYLQQCQIDGVDNLGKGMTSISAKFPVAYSRVYKYFDESNKMLNVYSGVKRKDTLFDETKNKLISLADSFAKKEVDQQQRLNNIQAGLQACNRLTDLLKAITNPDFYKVFSENKDGLVGGVDSLVSKYNFISRGTIHAAHGQLLSGIAMDLGKHSIRKRQKKYFQQAVDSAGFVMFEILAALRTIHLNNYQKDLGTINDEYFSNYMNLQSRLQDSTIKLETAKKMIDEMQQVKKDMRNLSLLGNVLENYAKSSQELIAALQESAKGIKPDCKKINGIITILDDLSAKVEAYSSFLK
jgi:hypothetical protein